MIGGRRRRNVRASQPLRLGNGVERGLRTVAIVLKNAFLQVAGAFLPRRSSPPGRANCVRPPFAEPGAVVAVNYSAFCHSHDGDGVVLHVMLDGFGSPGEAEEFLAVLMQPFEADDGASPRHGETIH